MEESKEPEKQESKVPEEEEPARIEDDREVKLGTSDLQLTIQLIVLLALKNISAYPTFI